MTSEEAPFAATNGPARGRVKRRGWMVIGLVAFLLGIGATLLVLEYVAPRLGWMVGNRSTAAAGQPVVAQAPARSADDARVQVQTLRSLSAREARIAGRIDELEARLATLDGDARAASGYAARAENMMVVVAARRALDRGRPLDYLETQLRNRFGNTRPQAVRMIAAAAALPVTLEDLRVGLNDAAPALVAGPVGEDLWSGIKRELSQLIIIRQGQSPSSRPADRLDRALRRMDAGQVELAVAEVERLPGAASASRWIEAANRYIAARRALIDLETVALEAPLPPIPATEPAFPIVNPTPDAQPAPLPTL